MSHTFKLNTQTLKQIISEEKKKLKDQGLLQSDTIEDAWAGGDNLVNKIDYIKTLGIKEAKLRRKADSISHLRRKLKANIVKDL